MSAIIGIRQLKNRKEVRVMGLADAVRFLRKCGVNELLLLERVLQRRKTERDHQRNKRELAKKAALIQLL